MVVAIADFTSILTEKLLLWYEVGVGMIPNILLSLIVIVVFYFVARAVKKPVYVGMKRSPFSDTLNNLTSTLVFLLIFGLGIVIALQVLKLDKAVVSLLAGAGILGLALAFAFQDTAANLLSGIILAFKKPFKIGDLIETNSYFGKVRAIGLRTTTLRTLQGQVVEVPNKDVMQTALVNYSGSGERRVDIDVGVSYGEDLEKVKKVTIKALQKAKNRNTKKPVELFYKEFGDSSINFTVRFWMKFTNTQKEYWAAVSDAIIRIKKAYNENSITIPFPIRTLDFGIKGGEKLDRMLKKR